MSFIRKIQNSVPDCTYHVDIGMGSLVDSLQQYEVNLDPEYQRSHVWTDEQKSLFVGAIIENDRSIPPFWFNWTNNRLKCEVVDGKQRINAILQWLRGEIIAKCPCGFEFWQYELDDTDWRNLRFSATMSWNFVDLDRIEVMKFYLRLNSGGTVHTFEDLEKVRKMIEELK